jgi:hypothetical protein
MYCIEFVNNWCIDVTTCSTCVAPLMVETSLHMLLAKFDSSCSISVVNVCYPLAELPHWSAINRNAEIGSYSAKAQCRIHSISDSSSAKSRYGKPMACVDSLSKALTLDL